MILQTAVKYFHGFHDLSNGHPGGDNPDKLPHFITSNLEHDSVKLVLEHLAEEGTASISHWNILNNYKAKPLGL